MIGEGVKVLIIDSIDATSGAGCREAGRRRRRQGHRLRPRQPRRHRAVLRVLRQRGRRQAAGPDPRRLPQRQQGVKNPKIIEMDGGTDVDNNAVLFKQGRPRGPRAAADRRQAEDRLRVGRQGLGRQQRRPGLHPGADRRRRQGRRRARRQRRHRQRRHRRAARATVSPARSSSPVRTPASRVCRTSSTASRA